MIRSLAVIGPGRLGKALASLSADAGYNVLLAGRAGGKFLDPHEAASQADAVMLTVPDRDIRDVCRSLAEAGAFRSSSLVAHCSGILRSDEVLASARDVCGCDIGSMHPLQTLPTAEMAIQRLPGSRWFLEGSEGAVGRMEELVQLVFGGVPIRINPDAKVAYHASAVLASNYVTVVLDAAMATASCAGIPEASYLPALAPMVRAAVENALAMGPRHALSGPIVRGDVSTVAAHVAALGTHDQGLQELYKALGKWAVRMVSQKGSLDASAIERLHAALGENHTGLKSQ
eukprot:jgi/Mesvir1/28582/Mv00997-RA.1